MFIIIDFIIALILIYIQNFFLIKHFNFLQKGFNYFLNEFHY